MGAFGCTFFCIYYDYIYLSNKIKSGLYRIYSTYMLEANPQQSGYDKVRLNDVLRSFYHSIRTTKGEYFKRKKKGEYFKRNTLNGIRYGLAKHFKTKGIDITDDPVFTSSREVFFALHSDMKKKGFGSTDHTSPISTEDLQILYSGNYVAFNINSPVVLQQKVWFELMFYLCRRGRENLRGMTRSTFEINCDASSRRFVVKKVDESDKNHKENALPDDTVGEGRMYELRDNPMCPVISFAKYLSKLQPENDVLWQRPLNDFIEDEPWYSRQPHGHNTLNGLMKIISISANLHQIYTNHSIRATTITLLDPAGIEARHTVHVWS